uniref:Uncharacterized protein n=1 Tax=Octopus bimaculoides TaxID=37653 RepID=A0A0L8GFC6_OCTBM
MVIFSQFFLVSLLFSNIVSQAKYFKNCSPGLCSDPSSHDIPERCSCRPDC